MTNLNVLYYLSEENWEALKESNTTFTVDLVKKLINELTECKNIIRYISEGLLFGYTIECPFCKIKYDISTKDISDEAIVCENCGNMYLQKKHIDDIICGE